MEIYMNDKKKTIDVYPPDYCVEIGSEQYLILDDEGELIMIVKNDESIEKTDGAWYEMEGVLITGIICLTVIIVAWIGRKK